MKIDEGGLSTTNISANKIKLAGEDLNTKLANLKLQNSSNIIENESNKLEFADEVGNIIAKIDENGFETTTVTAKKIIVEDINLKDRLETHIVDLTHLQEGEREKWNAKNDFNGDFNALTNSPLIQDDSGQIVFADEAGNIIAQLNTEGFKTTTISSNTIKINDIDIKPYLLEIDYQNLTFDLTETILENQIILPLTVLTFEKDGNYYFYSENNLLNNETTETFNIWFKKIYDNVGQTYIVEWDGVPFTTTATNLIMTDSNCTVLGNLSLINQEGIEYPDTLEPFLFMGAVSDTELKMLIFKTSDTAITHSIQITKVS